MEGKFKFLVIIPMLLFFSCSQKLDESKVIDENATAVIHSFFENLKSSNYKKALPLLLSQNENINLADSSTLKLENNLVALHEVSGPFIGYSLLKKKAVGDDLGVYSYLVKYDKRFYRFLFLFYNNGKKIKIYKFSFDDNIDLDLEESLKLYVN